MSNHLADGCQSEPSDPRRTDPPKKVGKTVQVLRRSRQDSSYIGILLQDEFGTEYAREEFLTILQDFGINSDRLRETT